MSFELAPIDRTDPALRFLATVATVALVLSCHQPKDADVAPLRVEAGRTASEPSDRFTIVTGAGYEGAIVKASDVLSSWRLDDESAWTPSADDVSIVEAELLKYLRRASTDPLRVDPPMILRPTQPPRDAAELRELVRTLPDQRRQYLGIARGAVRFLVVSAFPKDPHFDNWRNELMAGKFLDVGCAVWTARFDLTSRKLVSFGCSGSA